MRTLRWALTLTLACTWLSVAPVAQGRPRCDIKGTRAPEYLAGTSRSEVICGRGGGDTITGGYGRDVIRGGWGGDRIFSADGAEDWIDARSGRDQCFGDRGDHFTNCERIHRR